MAFDKKKFQARLEKMSADEIRVKLPHFGGTKKSVALDELTARGRDQELKAPSRKETAQWTRVIVAVVLVACALIALIILMVP